MARNKTADAIGYCDEHGKLLWPDRKTARAVARNHYETRKSVYRCSINSQFFHVGGLWAEVKHGDLSRADMRAADPHRGAA